MILVLILIGFILGTGVAVFALGGGVLGPVFAFLFFAIAALGPIAFAAAFAPHRRQVRVTAPSHAALDARLTRSRREIG